MACNSKTSEILNSYYLNFVLWEGKDSFWKSWVLHYKHEWGVNLLEHLLLLPENKIVLAQEWGYMKIYCIYLVEIFHPLTIYRKERYFKRWSIFVCVILDVCFWRTWDIRKIENTRLWSVREERITRQWLSIFLAKPLFFFSQVISSILKKKKRGHKVPTSKSSLSLAQISYCSLLTILISDLFWSTSYRPIHWPSRISNSVIYVLAIFMWSSSNWKREEGGRVFCLVWELFFTFLFSSNLNNKFNAGYFRRPPGRWGVSFEF